ncbi:MAG: 3-hydroxyacyl-CoA dehydrogenase NAD-binding domain-containing protein [Phyllobacterium sp.]
MNASANTFAFSDAVSGEIRDTILMVIIDNTPVNAVSAAVREGLLAALEAARKDAKIRGLVITGAGKTFVAGADIKEFGKPPVEPTLPQIVEQIEAMDKTVVAALNGAALGGGLEIALACHYRVAGSKAIFGMPEVKLGIVPGAGGTQRLPRLIGATLALDLIGTGRNMKADDALRCGLIDEKSDALIDAAIALAQNNVPRRTGALITPEANADEFAKVAASIRAKARGQQAPLEVIRLVEVASKTPAADGLAEGIADERATFVRLRDSDEAAALRHVFFAERDVRKVDGLDGVTPRSVNTIGVVGTGLMGSGITVAALDAGYTIIGVEQTAEAAAKGLERITGLIERNFKSGRISAEKLAEQKARLLVTAEAEKLTIADLVIEAVFDDFAVKTALFQRLDSIVREDAILATNTSYLNPDDIAAATRHPERVIGMHFFSPANIMRLVEVVRGAKTALDVLATGADVANRMRKLPVVTGVCEGFIGNRIFSAYRREAEFLLEDGALPQDIDAALEDYGFAMGLFAVNDMAGLEIAWARRKRQAETRDPSERYVDIADRLCEAGRFGQKSGRGWYLYEDGKRVIDPAVTQIIEEARTAKNIAPRSFSMAELQQRLLKAMADEGQALLDEGITARASDIDLVLINGYGFPAHKGGPMFAYRTIRNAGI